MSGNKRRIPYPRKRAARLLMKILGRVILPLFFKIEISGRENYPRSGPLLVVGNHTAAMEAVLLIIYSPWQIEMLSAADIPAEKITEYVSSGYGVIPLHRGAYDRAALEAALGVLDQQGVVGLFPEGGIWEEGKKEAHTGIAWLSYRSGAPVLPIGFNDTTGALHEGLALKRPALKMYVGKLIAAAEIPPAQKRKVFFQQYANQVMDAVHELVPPEDYRSEPEIRDESFQLEISLLDPQGENIPPPEGLMPGHPQALAKFLHRPAILKIFRINLDLSIDALQQLTDLPPTGDILQAARLVLNYLEEENPHLLTYRFGIQEGLAMQQSLEKLVKLASWAEKRDYQLTLKPIRHYYSLKKNRSVTQIEQGAFRSWM